jgi:hydroxymethylbilane synthase
VIALEIRQEDDRMQEITARINHQLTWQLMQAERAFLEYLQADCKTPLAAHAIAIDLYNIKVDFMLADSVCSNIIFTQATGNIQDARAIGTKAGMEMLQTIKIR